MSTIKSSDEHLTLNADGSSKDIKFQANGVQKASISSAGAFTSTTIDATALTGALPAIDGSSLTGTGKVLQVVNATYNTQTAVTSGSLVDTGLTAAITPQFSSSKILVSAHMTGLGATTTTSQLGLGVVRGSTEIIRFEKEAGYAGSFSSELAVGGSSCSYLDSPNTTSATTYKVQALEHSGDGTVYYCLSGSRSTLTLMEIAG